MSKHTEGPWEVRSGDGYPLQVVAHDGPGDAWVVAEICDEIIGDDGIDHCFANARLIAAAPELLSSAVDALSDFCWIEQTVPNSNFQASILKLKHAIQKANGPSALAVNVVERAPENNHEGIRPGSATSTETTP